MATRNVADLLRDGRIERITPDLGAARTRVGKARVHLESSTALAGSDPALAYVALYDAARKAITAHMLSNGFRVTNRPGAHQAVGLYAEATFPGGEARVHIRAFDRMRQIRNRSEYDHQPITEQLLSTDLDHARAIVEVVEATLP